MSMFVETAIVSKRGSSKDFNTDFINASGKLWSSQIVHGEKGVRAAGTGSGHPYYVLASSAKKGTAESAAGLFETCVEKFSEDGSNTALLIADYLKAFSRVLNETGFASSDCSFSMLSGFNDTVYVAQAGNNRLYTYYDDTFMEIKPQQTLFSDEKSSFGVAQCNHVKEGDIFILLAGAVTASLPEGILPAICKSAAGDVKKIVSLIASQAVKYGCKEAISAIVIKITSTDSAADETPVEEAIAAAVASLPDEKESEETEEPVPASEDTEKEEDNAAERESSGSKGKRAVKLIAILVVACAVITGALFGIKFWSESHGNPAANSTLDPSSVSASVSVSESQSASKTTQKTTETSTTKPTTTEPSSESASVTDSTTAAPTERYTSTTRSSGYDYEDETEEEPATTPVEDEPTEPTSQEEPTQSSENPKSTESEPTENDTEDNTPVEPSDE